MDYSGAKLCEVCNINLILGIQVLENKHSQYIVGGSATVLLAQFPFLLFL